MAAPDESFAVSANIDSFMAAANAAAANTVLGLGTGNSPYFTAVNIGHATDTTVTRVSAGVIAVEGATIATQTWVTAAIDAVIAAAPGALDTLNELAAALGDDASFASTVTTALAGKANLAGGNTFTGTQVVDALNATTANATTLNLAENGGIVLDAALSADGKYCGIVEAGTAGATLAFGDLVYLAAADSRWELADADAEATAGPVKLGMCVLAAAADGDPTTILLVGKIRADAAFPTMTISAPVYVGTTAGDIQVAKPSGTDDVVRVVGHANTADELYFNPDGFYITAV